MFPARPLRYCACTHRAGSAATQQLEAGFFPRPRVHIEGDGSGITNLGRFKESKNILALAGLWELIRLPRWNSCLLLLPHRPEGGRGRQVWEAQGAVPGPAGGSQEGQSPAGYRHSFFFLTWPSCRASKDPLP